MIEIRAAQSTVAGAVELKGRIVRFMQAASTEITPLETGGVPELASLLPAGTALYIAHTPNATLEQVVHAALVVQRAGFRAAPHIAVRRIATAQLLQSALAELNAAGVGQILLIAGDAARPAGEFSSTIDILERGILEKAGIARIGVAGHPEGLHNVDASLLWEALRSKQAFAARSGTTMHIVTQFGLDVGALGPWERELVRRNIDLPVHVGIAGPASAAKLIRFAIHCGVGASAHALSRGLSAAVHGSGFAATADQHLLALNEDGMPPRFVAPHFFAFGGAVETARWIRKIAAGAFDIDSAAGRLTLQD